MEKMRPTRSLASIDIGKDLELSDEELAYLQTQKALKDALAEQKVLKERLKNLETRNKPAKWGQPVLVQSFETTRGKMDSSNMSPEKLMTELKTSQHMLESAKRATEQAKAEMKDLQDEIETFKSTAATESEQIIQLNAKHHKEEAQKEQLKFLKIKSAWNEQKSALLSSAEQYSLVSHDALHKASQMREEVEGQRKKIQSLAAEFRSDLSKSKELRELLDEYKTKVALTDSLVAEIDANKRRSDQMLKQINEQKLLMHAVRISQAAKQKLDELAEQTKELNEAKKVAEQQYDEAKDENAMLTSKEGPLRTELEQAENEFKETQMEVLVLEAEIRELKAELSRMKPKAITEGRKNVGLQRVLKKKNMDATQKYLVMHQADVYEVDKVATYLHNVSSSLDHTAPLPPLTPPPKNN